MPRPKNNEARENILRCAYHRFMEVDYETVYLKDIAKDAGITTTLLHHYFPAKSDLIIHIIYDLLSKTKQFLRDNDQGKSNLKSKEEDGYAVMLATFYYMFDVLCRNNSRMLNAYSYVICDTKLMNDVVDFCNDNFNIPETVDTQEKQYGQFIFWGGVSQIVALRLKRRLLVTIKEAIKEQYIYFLISIGIDEKTIEDIIEAADSMSAPKMLDDFYKEYMDSIDHFIHCSW